MRPHHDRGDHRLAPIGGTAAPPRADQRAAARAQTLAMLAGAQSPVTLSVIPGADHVFLNIAAQVPGAQEELARISERLHATLSTV